MAIKTTQLKTAIFIASLTAATHPALAYDAFTESGAIPTEVHSFQVIMPPLSDPDCGVLCQNVGGLLEINVVMRIQQNITAGFTGGVANATIDNYVGTRNTASSGTMPIFLHLNMYFSGFDADYLSTYNPTIDDLFQAWTPYDWNFTTSVEGKITDGYFNARLPTYENGYMDIYDVSGRFAYTISGCSFDNNGFLIYPSITSIRAIDTTDLLGTMPATGCNTFEYKAPLAYLTCDTQDECGQFGKSVPVPIFATAMLCLGLLGVTLMTRKNPNPTRQVNL